jgi:hypothetical protein
MTFRKRWNSSASHWLSCSRLANPRPRGCIVKLTSTAPKHPKVSSDNVKIERSGTTSGGRHACSAAIETRLVARNTSERRRSECGHKICDRSIAATPAACAHGSDVERENRWNVGGVCRCRDEEREVCCFGPLARYSGTGRAFGNAVAAPPQCELARSRDSED